jgi:hypothetical protein
MLAVKTNLPFNQRMSFTALALGLLSVTAGIAAEPAPRPRGTPIIFSAPSKSDTVSSNLNELRTPTSPFRDLESELKKPFEALEPGQNANRIRPPRQLNQQPELNRKQMKERLHERAEAMFLSLEPDESGLDDELLPSADDSLNRFSKKSARSLDGDDDRADQNRAALTNRSGINDLFGEKKDQEGRLGFNSINKTPDALEERDTTSRNLRPISDGIGSADGLFSDRNKPRELSDPWGNSAEDAYERTKLKRETRLEEFKRLLDGPGATPRDKGGYGSVYNLAPQQPASRLTTTTPSRSAPKPAVTPAPTFAETAGLVGTPGAPNGLPNFAPASSLSTPPTPLPQIKPTSPSTFNIPKRRF